MSSSERAVVIGASGQLGSEIVTALASSSRFEVIGLSHDEVEVTNSESVGKALEATDPDVVVNTAAFHNVDDCEFEPERAFAVNAIGGQHVAREASRFGSSVVYVSTDYVFSGDLDRPYLEHDLPQPLNVYGASKLAGEHLTLAAASRALVVRVSSLFGITPPRGKAMNFIESIIARARTGEEVRVVDDVMMSPTYARDAAELIVGLVETETTGVVHGSNAGSCTWFELAQYALDLTDVNAKLVEARLADWPSVATKPSFSPMSSSRLDESGLHMRGWQEAVHAYLLEAGHLTGVPN